jgi:hypothetical protein
MGLAQGTESERTMASLTLRLSVSTLLSLDPQPVPRRQAKSSVRGCLPILLYGQATVEDAKFEEVRVDQCSALMACCTHRKANKVGFCILDILWIYDLPPYFAAVFEE